MKPTMQIEYRLSGKDYQEANQAHFKSQLWIYFFFWVFIIIGLLFLILSLVADTQLDVFGIVYFWLFAIIFFNPYFSNPLKNYFVARTWKGFASLHQPMSVEVNEEVLKIKSINFDTSMQWQLYIKAVETKNLFMLYQAKALFNMIPKRAFSSDEQVEEFRELLRTKIEKFQQV
jgi:hypothetical protein